MNVDTNQIKLKPGRYVVAVSGGVDSVALLHMLRQVSGMKLTVAHFDHDMRNDSAEDRRLVQRLAAEYRLPFVFAEGHLGAGASEAAARSARYQFLHKVRHASGAEALVTAHHMDDVLETAIINLVRGTNRKGLTSLRSTDVIRRPMLYLPKAAIRQYAASQGLVWREDSTNDDLTYMRNYVRHNVVTKLSAEQRVRLHDLIVQLRATNEELDGLLQKHLEDNHTTKELNRHLFIMLPHSVAREVMATWLRGNGVRSFDARMLERLVTAAKTKDIGKLININHELKMLVKSNSLALIPNER